MKRTMLALGVMMLTAFAPPSGRPPIGPLERLDPKIYDLTFEVTLQTVIPPNRNAMDRQNYDLKDAPVALPLIFLGTYSKIDSDSIFGKLWLESHEVDPKLELKDGFPFNTHLAVLNIERFQGQSLRWKVGYQVQVWSSRINDEDAMRIAWPKEWPDEVQDGLQPQKYIESDDPIFKETVERVSEGKLRLVPPYLAAKDLIRYAIENVQVTGDGLDLGEHGIMRGLEVFGAKHTAEKGVGTPHDLVCVCVAMLRAAGIPARPVIGAFENERGIGRFVTWAEFYLPEAGWIPFDPWVMRGKGIKTLNVRKPWPELGTLKDLNERIPLSYHFIPAATVESPKNPQVWGWDPRYTCPPTDAFVHINMASRGKGVDDPR